MKKLLIVLMAALAFSCSKDDPAPAASANFTFTGDNVFGPAKVTFTNTSINAVSYLWEFGDGSGSSDASPTHVFAAGKTYNVVLTALNSDGQPNKISKSVVILAAPTKVKITGIVLTAISFTNGAGAGWDVSDGPDIYFRVGNIKTGYVNNVQSSQLPITFNQNDIFPITASDLAAEVEYLFYDYDPVGGDQFMGGYSYALKNSIPTVADITAGGVYPTIVTLQVAGNPLKFNLLIEWLP